MLPKVNCLLVTATCFVGVCVAIRVEWNTNTGPILPPTPRTTPRPIPPFREPAPVWEELSNDLPNPNPYVYVLPPPSRPKQRLNTNVNYHAKDNSGHNFGTILTTQHSNTYQHPVASLSSQYVPNVGTRYVAVVPTSTITKTSPLTPSTNSLAAKDKGSTYKLQGKYNSKTKKYKAYEKVKYVPQNYSASLPLKPNTNDMATESQTVPKQKSAQLVHVNATAAAYLPPPKSYMKHLYAKDKPALKSKEKLTYFLVKAKKS